MENLHQVDHRIMLVHVAELPFDFDVLLSVVYL